MNQAKQHRIVKISEKLVWICWIGLIALPAIPILVWGLGSEKFLLSGEPYMYLIPRGILFKDGMLTPEIRFLGFLISIIPVGVLVSSLWQLKKLFSKFARMELFNQESIRLMRIFASHVVALGVLIPVSSTLMSLATSFGNPPGSRVISISLGSGVVTTLFIGLVFVTIAWLLEEGKRLAEENQQFV